MSEKNQSLGKLILRLAIGFNLLLHGIGKLEHGVAWMAGPLAKFGLPAFLGYGAYVGEVLAPLLLLLGIRSRLAGLVIAFDLLMAIVLVKAGEIVALSKGGTWGIELESLFLMGGLAIFCLGGGRFALSTKSRWD
jgi:putative oxidoreductase